MSRRRRETKVAAVPVRPVRPREAVPSRSMLLLASSPFVLGLVAAMAGTSPAHAQAVNLGGGVEISINDLAERIRQVVGSTSPIEHVPYERAYGPGYEDMRRRVPDNSLACALVNFRPATNIDDMIRSIAEYQRAGHPGDPDAALTMA